MQINLNIVILLPLLLERLLLIWHTYEALALFSSANI